MRAEVDATSRDSGPTDASDFAGEAVTPALRVPVTATGAPFRAFRRRPPPPPVEAGEGGEAEEGSQDKPGEGKAAAAHEQERKRERERAEARVIAGDVEDVGEVGEDVFSGETPRELRDGELRLGSASSGGPISASSHPPVPSSHLPVPSSHPPVPPRPAALHASSSSSTAQSPSSFSPLATASAGVLQALDGQEDFRLHLTSSKPSAPTASDPPDAGSASDGVTLHATSYVTPDVTAVVTPHETPPTPAPHPSPSPSPSSEALP